MHQGRGGRAGRRHPRAGWPARWSRQKERVTRTGSRMAWVRISDASGSCEVTLFSEVLARARDILANGANVLVTAELRLEGEALRITAQDVTSLDQAAAHGRRGDAHLAARRRRRCRTSATCWAARDAARGG